MDSVTDRRIRDDAVQDVPHVVLRTFAAGQLDSSNQFAAFNADGAGNELADDGVEVVTAMVGKERRAGVHAVEPPRFRGHVQDFDKPAVFPPVITLDRRAGSE